MLPDMQYAMQQSQQALSAAMQQVSTGLRVNQLSDDPSASADMVTSLAASANVDQYTSNVSSLLPQMQTADSAISAVITSLNAAITIGTEGANGIESAADRQGLATQVQNILSSVISQANTSFQGTYLFGGSGSTTPPFVAASTSYTSTLGSTASPLATTTPLTAGSVTTISDATTGKTMSFKAVAGDTISTLQGEITREVAAGTLSAGISAAINAGGQLAIGENSTMAGIVVSSSDPVLGSMTATTGTQVANSFAYVGTIALNNVQVGDSLSVSTNVPGNQLFTGGPNVIGSLSGLITALQTGTTTQIATATSTISTALNYVSQQRIPLGNTMNQLNSQESYLGQEKVTLTTQQTSLIGISLSVAATNLSQAELANSAVMAAAAKVLPQTLLDYLK